MDKKYAIEIAEKFIAAINGKYRVKSAWLFGSYVNGNQKADSDIDIAIVMNDFDDRFTAQFDLMKLRRNIDLRIEPHPFREKDFSINDPMVNEIMKSGIQLKYSA
jgi:predicted nucleotidyltransferase